ncbi:hypothetical protein [Muribacter muris]|uniref:hypothetical protein n=1 Tax=Muribacter muris TaxID=67855 RepID=UPI001D1690F3|nr:hypothetical protein [Muribacter muris]
MPESLTFQAYIDGSWKTIATLDFNVDYSVKTLTYLYDLEEILGDNHKAVSLNYPTLAVSI